MPRILTLNYAAVQQQGLRSRNNGDGTVTFTVYYTVGYKPAVGAVVIYNANAVSVTLTQPVTATYAAIAVAIQDAIAAAEGLDLAAGDVVALP